MPTIPAISPFKTNCGSMKGLPGVASVLAMVFRVLITPSTKALISLLSNNGFGAGASFGAADIC
ncbi:hypothetical protein D3C87_1640730 [compost metagenome]